MKGYVHSIESFGTVDGPGIRLVVFMQGCPMRCLYCHNPDTWKIGAGKETDAKDIIEEYNKNRAFYKKGGITVTGGEPLVQIDFLIELFRLCKKNGIHTCIDTSGVTYSETNLEYMAKLDELMDCTSLVLLDIKHIDSDKHKELTGRKNENILAFAKYLEEKRKPLWVRHVVLPGYTDDEAALTRLGEFIGGLKNLRALDVLPYHTLGVSKYAELGIEYPLEGKPSATAADAARAKGIILSAIHKTRNKNNE
jgi:pyruvate formate lyase activating enzyme